MGVVESGMGKVLTCVVIAVYGVLFLDWNDQGRQDASQPFEGVCLTGVWVG